MSNELDPENYFNPASIVVVEWCRKGREFNIALLARKYWCSLKKVQWFIIYPLLMISSIMLFSLFVSSSPHPPAATVIIMSIGMDSL